MRKRVVQARRLRGSMLACAGDRAVAMSMLDLPGARAADGDTPAGREVERDFMHGLV